MYGLTSPESEAPAAWWSLTVGHAISSRYQCSRVQCQYPLNSCMDLGQAGLQYLQGHSRGQVLPEAHALAVPGTVPEQLVMSVARRAHSFEVAAEGSCIV